MLSQTRRQGFKGSGQAVCQEVAIAIIVQRLADASTSCARRIGLKQLLDEVPSWAGSSGSSASAAWEGGAANGRSRGSLCARRRKLVSDQATVVLKELQDAGNLGISGRFEGVDSTVGLAPRSGQPGAGRRREALRKPQPPPNRAAVTGRNEVRCRTTRRRALTHHGSCQAVTGSPASQLKILARLVP